VPRLTARWLAPSSAASNRRSAATCARAAGRYFVDCREAELVDPAAAGQVATGVAPHALDPAAAEKLWEISEQMMR
jgi:hypothetical protein